jgi:hypothetical protein
VKPTPQQGRRLIALLKRRGMTYGQMLATGISTSPWKRVAECLRADEKLMKTPRHDGLVVWRVANVKCG